ncbi:MAG: Crp/Fnr family transcriptional regulator [Bacteroidaceae bacterium]|nr:Crp/Fnr family transcriptional regulator [Bacteroidaceae bacterium]
MRLVVDNSKDAAREIARLVDMRLSFDALSNLTALLSPQKYRHRTFIQKPGDTTTAIAFVAKGLIMQYIQKDDVEIVYDVCHEDDMLFNMESLISQTPSSLYILTLEPTVIYTIDYQELKLLASKLPEINELLTRLLERCIMRMTTRQHTLDLPPMERYLALMEADSEIIRRTPLKHVAWYLRMAPETLSRVRNKLNNRENSNS